jgi:hypothetical protein
LAVSGVALVIGAVAWSWLVYLRGTRVSDFALGRLPGWPFPIYVLGTIAGLLVLGAGLLAGSFPGWTSSLTIAAALGFLVAYLRLGDLPPFVFYLLFILIGIAIR